MRYASKGIVLVGLLNTFSFFHNRLVHIWFLNFISLTVVVATVSRVAVVGISAVTGVVRIRCWFPEPVLP